MNVIQARNSFLVSWIFDFDLQSRVIDSVFASISGDLLERFVMVCCSYVC